MGKRVCIDVGHYKGYNHSPGVPEYCEGDRMWVLGEQLIAELKKRGVTVVQTRTNIAKDLALVSRGKASKGCDLFLSLHSNAVGAAMNEKVDYPLAMVMLDGSSTQIGLELAKVVEKLMGTTQDGRTTIKRNSSGGEWYGVLRGAAAVGTPGVILEHSFHTNTKMSKWLLSDENLKKLAKAEAECIVSWLGIASPLPYTVRVSIGDLHIRCGPGTRYASTGFIKPGVYTIVDESGGWGKLKSGAGWISLKYTTKT